MNTPALKFFRLALHVLHGAFVVLTRFPRVGRDEKSRLVTWWSGGLLKILNVRARSSGPLPGAGGALVVGNHVSWLDIHLLHSLLPARMVSKAEVRGWPLIGWLAEAAGTVFLVREKKADAMRVNQIMGEHLRDGDCLALFPEGTTSDGTDLLPFFPSLFQPAVDAATPIWPVLIRYRNADASLCLEAAYYGDISLANSLKKVAGCREIHAEVRFLPPIPVAGRNRRELAKAAEAALRQAMAERNAPA